MTWDRYGRGSESRRGISPRLGRGVVGSTIIPGLTTTVADRKQLLEKLQTEVTQLTSDILPARTQDLQSWWERQGQPLAQEFRRFYDERKDSWWTNFQTDWSTYTDWQDRILALREAAKVQAAKAGQQLSSPDPSDIPRTPWDPHGGFFDQFGKETKTALEVGGIAIGAVLLLLITSRRG